MKTIDWSQFTTRIDIKSDREEIFRYFIVRENIEKWFLSEAIFYSRGKKERDHNEGAGVGDTYRWMWHGSDDVANGEVLENNNKDRFKFTFLGCTVTVQLKEEEGQSIVELTQSDIALDDASRMSNHVGCTRGWTFYLTNLKSILEGGIDLRNRNHDLTDMINS